jgi:hypothetical protein
VRTPFTSLAVAILLATSPFSLRADDDVSANNPLIPPLFSIDPNSPEVAGGLLLPGDLLLPTGPNMPAVEIPAVNLGLLFPADNVDGLALGATDVGLYDTFVAIFSVDREAVGAVPPDPNLAALGYPFNVQDQASKNQAASDAFMSLSLFDRFGPVAPIRGTSGRPRGYNNTLVINGGDAGGVDFRLSPAGLSPSQLNPPSIPQSNLNGGGGTQTPPPLARSGEPRAVRQPYDRVFFSLAAGSPSLPLLPGTGSGADIYIDTDPNTPAGQLLYVAPAVLGLLPTDDIDALIVFEDGVPGFASGADQILFSLAPDSPSLAGGFGPGDVFSSEGFGVFELYSAADQLGLAFTDNLNMLDYVFCDHIPTCVYEWAIGHLSQCAGDINGDGTVNITDLAILLAAYGACQGAPQYYPGADLYGDDDCVTLADLALLLSHYGETCP